MTGGACALELPREGSWVIATVGLPPAATPVRPSHNYREVERMPKVLTTEQLIEANKLAVKKDYNKSIVEEFMENLDPEGLHVVVQHLYHYYENGDAIRARIWTKIAGSMDPLEIWIDIPIGMWKRLSEAADVVQVAP
jgi:hypothetical protein